MSRRLLFCLIMLTTAVILLSSGGIMAQGSANITIFRDEDSLTVYVPPGTPSFSLAGITFEVLMNGQTVSYRLDEDFIGFAGLEFNDISGPFCFYLVSDESQAPPPQQCTTLDTRDRLTQTLSKANVFWYDGFAKIMRVLTVKQGSQMLIQCPPDALSCQVSVPQIFLEKFNCNPLKPTFWDAGSPLFQPQQFAEVADGRLHINVQNTTGQWQEWDLAFKSTEPYASVEAEIQLARVEGGEGGLGIRGAADNNCFQFIQWANPNHPNEAAGRGRTGIGELSGDPAACWSNMTLTDHPVFPLNAVHMLGASFPENEIKFMRDGEAIGSGAKKGADNLHNQLMIHVELDASASLEGYIDNFLVRYEEPDGTPPPPPPPTDSLTPSGCVSVKAVRDINVRGGSGTNYPIVSGLKAGDVAGVRGRYTASDGVWLRLNSDAQQWVAARVVEVTGDTNNCPIVEPPPPPPFIRITSATGGGSGESTKGIVEKGIVEGVVGPRDYCTSGYRVVFYAGTDKWHLQPFDNAYIVPIQSDCKWRAETFPWDELAAFLVPADNSVPPAQIGDSVLNPQCPNLDIGTRIIASTCRKR